MRIRNLTKIFTPLLLVCTASAYAEDFHIAFKYDESSVVFVTGTRSNMYRPSKTESGEVSKLSDPEAKLSGFQLYPADPKNSEMISPLSGGVNSGDQFTLLLGRQNTVTVTIREIVPANVFCSAAAVAIADVPPEQRNIYASSREKYFLVAKENPGPPSAARLGLDGTPLPQDKRDRIRRSLSTILEIEAPRLIKQRQPELDRISQFNRGWTNRRQQLNQGLLAGNTELSFNTQRVWLNATNPLYYVRARWAIGGESAFGLSTWIVHNMLVMSVDLRAARMLYLPEMRGRDIGNQEYGLILNLFDHDRDGNGEILFYQSGYEGAGFSLIEYADEKFEPTGIELRMGC